MHFFVKIITSKIRTFLTTMLLIKSQLRSIVFTFETIFTKRSIYTEKTVLNINTDFTLNFLL